MRIAEAQALYRDYGKSLAEQRKALAAQKEMAEKKYERTGDTAFSDEAATLELSINALQKKYDDNRKVLDALGEQHTAVWNAEVAKQQADAEKDYMEDMGKVMTVAMRMTRGDMVPYQDEKKLQEADPELYKIAKNAQMMMQQLKDKIKKYDSLWDEEEDKAEYDPEGKADNAEVAIDLPDIPQEAGAGAENIDIS